MPAPPNSSGEFPEVFFSVKGEDEALEEKIENQKYRNRLSDILSDEERSASEKLQSILQLGAEWFGVEHGHLVRIDPAEGTHRVTEVNGPHPAISKGDVADLSTTYCRRVMAQSDPVALENAPEQGWKGDPAYEAFELSTYLGAKVVVGGKLYGTVCFVDREPRTQSFGEEEAAALALIVRAVEQKLGEGRREDFLRGSPARLEALFRSIPEMVYLHDAEGNLILPNPHLCDETGYAAEELAGMKVWDLDVATGAAEAKVLWREMEPGDRRRLEGEYQCRDGTTFPVKVDLRCIELEGKVRFVVTAQDITDRKRRERRYEAIFNQTYQFIGLMEPDGTLLEANDTALRFGGIDREDVVGKPFWEAYWWRVDEETQRDLREAIGRAAEGEFVRYEVEVQGAEENRIIDFSIRPVTDERGEVHLLIPEGRDITERKKQERRLDAVFNQTYQFIGLMEPDGTLIKANDTALQFGGLDREEVLDKPFWETYWWQISEETKQRLREAVKRAAEGEFVRYEVEVQGGERNITIDFSIRPVTGEDGEVTLLIPEGRNITELKALKERERKLKRTRDLLAQAQRMANVGGWKIDVREGPPYVPEWTDELYDLFELSPEEDPTLEEILQHFPPEAREERRAAAERAIESGEGWDQESRMVTAEGNERWVRSIGTAVIEEGEVTMLQGAFQDITERKERENQLERQNRRLDQFASLVSHDLRGPLNVLKGRLSLAQEDDDPSHLVAAERAASRMDEIIEDLLTLTWGGQDVSPDDLELHDLASVAKASWDYVDTTSATLHLDGELCLRADEGRLQRLLENLFRNAVEHGGKAVTVRVGALGDGFFVEDDGPGIPKEKREKVLEAGYSSREEGTGLGLSITQAIAETHGWTLSVTEGEEGGARFEITGTE